MKARVYKREDGTFEVRMDDTRGKTRMIFKGSASTPEDAKELVRDLGRQWSDAALRVDVASTA